LSGPDSRRHLLFRRRSVWVPTLWGWAALLVVVGLVMFWCLSNLNRFLSQDHPARGADGAGAHTLVVEGWLEQDQLLQAVAWFKAGHYERVLTTGGPITDWDSAHGEKSYALRAADFLRTHGLQEVPVTALPAPTSLQERTHLSALMVRDWARRSGIALDAIDVFTGDVHARRTRITFGMALGPGVDVGVIAARATDYDDLRWWSSSAGAKATLGELLGVAWTTCCFWPAAQ
jgi:hypothetical protein